MVEQDGRLSAQVAVLGSLLIQPELVGQALEKIHPEDFLTPKCRMVFQAIKSLYTEGRPTDPVTVRGRLGGRDGDSWTEYLLELMDLTPTAANVWEYAALMREQARMAKVAELGSLLQAARDLDGARGYIAQLNELLVERRGVQRMDMAQMLLTFTDRHSGTPVEYMTWGLPKIDAGTYAEMGDMVVLGGYPSAGKTALAVSMAYHQSKDRRVGFYSLETNQYKLADRLMANLAGIEMPTIKRNEITGEQWQRLADRSDRIRARKLELIEASGMSAQDIQAYVYPTSPKGTAGRCDAPWSGRTGPGAVSSGAEQAGCGGPGELQRGVSRWRLIIGGIRVRSNILLKKIVGPLLVALILHTSIVEYCIILTQLH